MASKKTAAGMELIVAKLKKDPKVSYADVKAAADKKKVTVYPIMYGRAKAMLGLVPSAKRGESKAAKAKAKAAKRGPGRPKGSKNKRGPGRPKGSKNKRGPGRPRKVAARSPGRPRQTTGSPLDSIRDLVAAMRDTERDNAQLRSTLEKIGDLIARAV